MRSDSSAFLSEDRKKVKQPFYVCELSFDSAYTDLFYLTNHSKSDLPSTVTTNYIHGVVTGLSVISQTINPLQATSSIGKISIQLTDIGGQISSKINEKLVAGDGLRGKRVRIYIGYEGLQFSDYTLVQTQIVETISYNNGIYNLRCEDIQRTTKKDVFDIKKTTLGADVFEDIEGDDLSFAAGDNSINSTATTFPSYPTASPSTFQVYISGASSNSDGFYTITSVSDNKITFLESITTEAAGATIKLQQGTVTAASTTDFEKITHGTSFSDAPSATVGYFRIENEIFRYTGSTSTTFTGVRKGVLNTTSAKHVYDATVSSDRQLKIEEVIYMEWPAIRIAKEVLLGTNVPAHWSMEIPAAFVNSDYFDYIGTDIYDTSDDEAGRVLRFVGLTKRDGKRFLQQQVYRMAGVFPIILADGKIGIKRMTGVVSDASYVELLNESNVISYSALEHQMDNVHNQFAINWNYIDGKNTRNDTIVDQDSIDKHGTAEPLTINAEGLFGNRHTQATLGNIFDALRDRHAGPPLLITVDCAPTLNHLEVGDIVRLDLDAVRDYSGEITSIDRSFEIQSVAVNWFSGVVTLTLFGSSEQAGPIAYGTTTVLTSSIYTAAGTDISTVTTGSVTGSVWHITGNSSITGNADISAAGARYYYNNDIQIDDGVTLSTTQNTIFYINGHIQFNGTVDCSESGISGATGDYNTAGTSGFVGTNQAGGQINHIISRYDYGRIQILWTSDPGVVTEGQNQAAPLLDLINNGTSIAGIPTDLRPSSGGSGGSFNVGGFDQGTIGTGGTGGGALVFVCQSASFGANGRIITSGGEGGAGGSYDAGDFYGSTLEAYAGGGAPGNAGPVYFLIDGNSSTTPANRLTATVPGVLVLGDPLPDVGKVDYQTNTPKTSYYTGTAEHSESNALFRIQYIPPNYTAAEDVSEITQPPTAITTTEGASTENPPNKITLKIGATAPTDGASPQITLGNYSYANIYIRESGQTGWTPIGESISTTDTVTYIADISTSYDIKAVGVSTAGIESTESATRTFTTSAETSQVSRDVTLKGVSTFINDVIYYDDMYSNINFTNHPSGETASPHAWVVDTTSNPYTTIYWTHLGDIPNNGDYKRTYIDASYRFVKPSWDVYKSFEALMRFQGFNGGSPGRLFGSEGSIVMGGLNSLTSSGYHIGFYFSNSGANSIIATYKSAVTTSPTTGYQYTLSTPIPENTWTRFKVEYEPLQYIKWYIDDTLVHTVTAQSPYDFPTSSPSANYLINIVGGPYKTTAGPSPRIGTYFDIGQIRLYSGGT